MVVSKVHIYKQKGMEGKKKKEKKKNINKTIVLLYKLKSS